MKFIELFAGIGGFRVGLELAGHECVWANEWLERPRRIYKRNFGEYPNDKDIRAINLSSEIPKADLLTAGFPCATFSIAGKRTGFHASDARGTLFFEICRILRLTGIPYFLLENVKGLLNHDNGRTLAVMLSAMDEYGYDCQWEVLNSKNFGVAQNRERIFIVGHLRGTPRPKVFPIGRPNKENDGEERKEQKKGIRIREGFSQISPTIDANYYKGDDGKRPFVEVAHTVGVQDRHGIMIKNNNDTRIRKLTPLECERLQGLPDNFTKYYDDGTLVSDSERYERCGRTVTINVIEEIGRKLGYEWY
tara:strand:+ start:59 stop:976 length:918 start_codon:yes stop_codon:yes gene_type:complete